MKSKYFKEKIKPKTKILRSYCLNESILLVLDSVSIQQQKSKSEVVEAAINFLYDSMIKDGEIK